MKILKRNESKHRIDKLKKQTFYDLHQHYTLLVTQPIGLIKAFLMQLPR